MVYVLVGDVLALSKLIYKIVLELKKNSNAAPEFQLLLVELESLDRNLKVLQKIEPVRHELRRLDAIKALALACHRPLEEFLIKTKRFEDDLGACTSRHNRVLGFPRRLQWAENATTRDNSSLGSVFRCQSGFKPTHCVGDEKT